MHSTHPNQTVRILTVEIAVPANESHANVSDAISGLLSEQGICTPGSLILDWQYAQPYVTKIAEISAENEEGEAFCNPVIRHENSDRYREVWQIVETPEVNDEHEN